jgi:hypothetical protein
MATPCPRTRPIIRPAAASRPCHTRFKKGQPGNPRGPRPKNLPALLIEALDEPVTATIDGGRREITKREAVVTQLVNKSAAADLRATEMLVDMLKDAEKRPAWQGLLNQPPLSRPTRKYGDPSSSGCANPGRKSRHRLQGAPSHRGSCLHLCGQPERPGDCDPRLPDRSARPDRLIGKFSNIFG